MNLSVMDVRSLTEEPSVQVRGQLAAKIAMDYRANSFNDAEAAIANDIFRILLKDAERQVRRALAGQLAHCPEAPRDIVLKLAHDESDVASGVLEYSDVLTEDDLKAIIKSAHDVV